jgi:hypothetical protein
MGTSVTPCYTAVVALLQRGAEPRRKTKVLGRGLHSFPFPLNLSLPCPFPLNLSLICPPYNQN